MILWKGKTKFYLFRGKSKFYREFMIQLIKDILAVTIYLLLGVGTVIGLIYIIK